MRTDMQIHPDFSKNLRRRFADVLLEYMEKDPNIILLTGDLGYKILDSIRDKFPNRFINVGAAEQVLVGMGVGLALEGYIPVVYSMSSFILNRPFEIIRNYINHEQIPVKLVGSGRAKDYAHDGISHWADDDKMILSIFSNIIPFWPETVEELSSKFEEIIYNGLPTYVNLKK